MAQCFVSANARQTRQLHAEDPEDYSEHAISTQHPIYIFPSPPSAPPSPGQGSSPSRDSVYSSVSAPTLSSDTFHNLDQWEWPEGSPTDEQWPTSPFTAISPRRLRREDQVALTLRPHPLQDHLSRLHLYRISTNISISPISRRSFHTLSTSSSSDISVRTPAHLVSPIPHARIHIPFLSFILSLLPIDDSTIFLLTHTSPHSALFPGDEIMSDPCLMVSERQGIADTKASQSLLEFDEEHLAYARLREGHAVACDYDSALIGPFFGLSLSNLLGFVRGLVKKRRKDHSSNGQKNSIVERTFVVVLRYSDGITASLIATPLPTRTATGNAKRTCWFGFLENLGKEFSMIPTFRIGSCSIRWWQ
ncbi:hypothetical protein F5887DRAFT_946086 [Amanita rubescens]|nr:hypothetical protein F5887DRAFT_946086 [Amanita rubescens]